VLQVQTDRGGSGVAVIANGYWPAKQGRDALDPLDRHGAVLLHELREGGFTLTELKELRRPSGQGVDPAFSLQDLKALGYTCKDMRRAGFTLAELKNGYTAADMKLVHATTKAELANDGFSLAELKLAGFHAPELKIAGFSVKDLTAVGFTKADINGN
jgi:ribosomal protein L13E